MEQYNVENLTLDEISALRHALNFVDIKGSSAQFIANLQMKLERVISDIQLDSKKETPSTKK